MFVPATLGIEKIPDPRSTIGRQIRSLCHPLTYDGDGKPNVGAFPIQPDEAAQVGMVEALDHRVAATKDGFVYSLPT